MRGAGRLLRRHVPPVHPFHAHSTCVSRPMPMARRHWLPHCRSRAASRFGLPPLALACAITGCLTVINHFSYPCVTLWTREAPTSPSFISLYIYGPHHLYVDEEAVVVAAMRRPVLLKCIAQTPSCTSVCVASRSFKIQTNVSPPFEVTSVSLPPFVSRRGLFKYKPTSLSP